MFLCCADGTEGGTARRTRPNLRRAWKIIYLPAIYPNSPSVPGIRRTTTDSARTEQRIMAEKVPSTEETPKPETPAPTPAPPKRGLGHRGADPRDTAAELAARAHAISLEAGSKM